MTRGTFVDFGRGMVKEDLPDSSILSIEDDSPLPLLLLSFEKTLIPVLSQGDVLIDAIGPSELRWMMINGGVL
jgi:hypothetical protein